MSTRPSGKIQNIKCFLQKQYLFARDGLFNWPSSVRFTHQRSTTDQNHLLSTGPHAFLPRASQTQRGTEQPGWSSLWHLPNKPKSILWTKNLLLARESSIKGNQRPLYKENFFLTQNLELQQRTVLVSSGTSATYSFRKVWIDSDDLENAASNRIGRQIGVTKCKKKGGWRNHACLFFIKKKNCCTLYLYLPTVEESFADFSYPWSALRNRSSKAWSRCGSRVQLIAAGTKGWRQMTYM